MCHSASGTEIIPISTPTEPAMRKAPHVNLNFIRFDLKTKRKVNEIIFSFFFLFSNFNGKQLGCNACVPEIFVFDDVKLSSGFEMVSSRYKDILQGEDDGGMIKVT